MSSQEELFRLISGKSLDNEALLEILFEKYRIARNNKSVYSDDNCVPQNLIKMYYKSSKKADFSVIMNRFKTRYIIQESRIEQVHEKAEREGLGVVYDYITSDDWKSFPNIYLILKLHSILYSKTPFPEAGGTFRKIPVYLPGSGIPTTDPDLIFKEVTKLDSVFKNLLEVGTELGKDNSNGDQLINYINKCLELKCKLIEIHPFYDGNGRTMRALTNILFKVAGLPPVYITLSQKHIYEKAMNKAIMDNDYSHINQFYYYRICDSIYKLDMEVRKKQLSDIDNDNNRINIPKEKKLVPINSKNNRSNK